MNGQRVTIGQSMLDSRTEARIVFMRPGSMGSSMTQLSDHDLHRNAHDRALALARAGIRYGGQPEYGETTAELMLDD